MRRLGRRRRSDRRRDDALPLLLGALALELSLLLLLALALQVDLYGLVVHLGGVAVVIVVGAPVTMVPAVMVMMGPRRRPGYLDDGRRGRLLLVGRPVVVVGGLVAVAVDRLGLDGRHRLLLLLLLLVLVLVVVVARARLALLLLVVVVDYRYHGFWFVLLLALGFQLLMKIRN